MQTKRGNCKTLPTAHGNRGAAYVLALVTMLVGTVLALAMLQAGNSYFLTENSRTKKQAAIDMALAGVHYAYWKVQYKAQTLPYSADVTLSTGSFHVDATDDGARDPSTMLITSTGTCGGHSYTVKRITLGLLPYHYAWCENGKVTLPNGVGSNTLGPGMRANDSISLSSNATQITTGTWSSGTIASAGIISPQYPQGPPIAFPSVNYSSCSSIATTIYNWDTTLYSLNYPSGAVILVNGNVTINPLWGWYQGVITVVATGNITVSNNLSNADSSSYLALITNHTITLQNTFSYAVAALYAHKDDKSAKIVIQGMKTIVGTVSSDNITIDQPIVVNHDSGLTLDIMRQLHLPGL